MIHHHYSCTCDACENERNFCEKVKGAYPAGTFKDMYLNQLSYEDLIDPSKSIEIITSDNSMNSSECEPVFNSSLFGNIKVSPKWKYSIGVDMYDENNFAYCLLRDHDKSSEVVLSQIIKDRIEFINAVKTLSKCFSAVIIGEFD